MKDGAVDVVGSAQDPRLAGVTVNGVTANVTGSTWLAPHVPLAEGSNTLTAHATDRAGNAADASRAVVRDSQPPVLTVTDPAPGTVVPGATITLRGTASDPHLDRVEVNGVRAQLAAGAWSLAVNLQEGNNDFAVQAFDSVANAATAAVAVSRDSQAPAVTIAQPAEGAHLNAQSVTVSGTVAQKPGITVTVNGSAATVTGGAFTLAGVPLVEGDNTLIVRAKDSLGNEGTYTRKVVRDTAAPTLLSSDPAAGALALPVDTVSPADLLRGDGHAAGRELAAGDRRRPVDRRHRDPRRRRPHRPARRGAPLGDPGATGAHGLVDRPRRQRAGLAADPDLLHRRRHRPRRSNPLARAAARPLRAGGDAHGDH